MGVGQHNERQHTVLEGTGEHKYLLGANGEVSTQCTGVCQEHYGQEQCPGFIMEKGVIRYCAEGGVTDRVKGSELKNIRYCPVWGKWELHQGVLKGTVGISKPWGIMMADSQTLVSWLMEPPDRDRDFTEAQQTLC